MKRKERTTLKRWIAGSVDRWAVWFLEPDVSEAFTIEEAVGYIEEKQRRGSGWQWHL